MWLKSIEISNYQGFDNSGIVELDQGFNLVVGRNNTGKSALLRALSLRPTGSPHLSLRSVPHRGSARDPLSRVQVVLMASGIEVRDIIFSQNRQWTIPCPAAGHVDAQLAAHIWERIVAEGSIPFYCTLTGGLNSGMSWEASGYPAMRAYDGRADPPQIINMSPDYQSGRAVFAGGPVGIAPNGDSGTSIAQTIAGGIYHFAAERLHLARHAFGASETLAQNAANLPEVLSTLRRNPPRFEAYAKLIQEVFPSITDVTVQPLGGNQVEIMIWQTPRELERDDLAISLESCGTGVGQVLAILYVVKTSDSPRTIIIDEPNSFLHPGAARTLVRILKRFNQHQYIIATHSPEVISEVGPARVINIRFTDGRSIVEQFDTMSVGTASGILGDLGARLSDVLGYERVVWVEGPSDADAFTLVARKFEQKAISSVFLPVRSTAAFEDRVDLRDVLHLHRQLTNQSAPVPPAVRFLFDREGRSVPELEELQHESNGSMRFLPRRMLENYLLDAEALAALINHLDCDRPDPLTSETVTDWLVANGGHDRFLAPGLAPRSGQWNMHVHGAKLLNALVNALTEARYVYRKTNHAPWLVAWLLKHRPAELEELTQIVGWALEAD